MRAKDFIRRFGKDNIIKNGSTVKLVRFGDEYQVYVRAGFKKRVSQNDLFLLDDFGRDPDRMLLRAERTRMALYRAMRKETSARKMARNGNKLK